MKPRFFPCPDSDCWPDIYGMSAPDSNSKRCSSTADCSGGRECYRTNYGYSECIFMATMKPRFFPCHSDSDCAADEECYRAGTAYAECINGLGAPDSKNNMCDGSMGNYNCVCPKGFWKVSLRTQNGRTQFHCKVISSIGIVIPSIEESLGVDKPVSNDCSSDSDCPADEQCLVECSGASYCGKEKALASVSHGCCSDSECGTDEHCYMPDSGVSHCIKKKTLGAAHKHKKSKSSSSDSSDSVDGHNRHSTTPAPKNVNLDAVLFSNTFQSSFMQVLAIVGVLYVLYLGYRSAPRALRSKFKYETIPSATAEQV